MTWALLAIAVVAAAAAGFVIVTAQRRRDTVDRDSALLIDTMRQLTRGDRDARIAMGRIGALGDVAVALNDLAESGQDTAEREDERQRLDGVLLSINRQVRAELDFDAIALGTALTVQDELAVDRVWLRVFSDALNPDGFVVAAPDDEGGALPVGFVHLFQRVALAVWTEGTVARFPVPEDGRHVMSRDEELTVWLELAPRGVDTFLVVPLGAADEVLGYMILGRGASAPRWRTAEIDAAGEIGMAVGQALANVRIIAREYRVAVEMREIDRQKTELVSNVSHELRTPLTSISGYVEMLRDGEYGELSDDVDETLAVVERSTARLRELIENLLVLSRSEATQGTHERRPVDLRTTIRDAVAMLGPEASARSVALTADVGGSPVEVVGDRSALERVVLNLVNNAVKFTPAEGAVTVTLATRGATAVVTVTDTGIGIVADEQARVFDRFYRASNASHRGIRGTGLGLAITRSIIEDHGGAITLRSEEGEGTEVEFTLRLAAPAE